MAEVEADRKQRRKGGKRERVPWAEKIGGGAEGRKEEWKKEQAECKSHTLRRRKKTREIENKRIKKTKNIEGYRK